MLCLNFSPCGLRKLLPWTPFLFFWLKNDDFAHFFRNVLNQSWMIPGPPNHHFCSFGVSGKASRPIPAARKTIGKIMQNPLKWSFLIKRRVLRTLPPPGHGGGAPSWCEALFTFFSSSPPEGPFGHSTAPGAIGPLGNWPQGGFCARTRDPVSSG